MFKLIIYIFQDNFLVTILNFFLFEGTGETISDSAGTEERSSLITFA